MPLPAKYQATIDRIRSSLPVEAYTRILHVAATTGLLPLLDHNGQPTNQAEQLPALTRLDLIQYLTDKVLPAPKAEQAKDEPPPLEVIAERSTILRHLTVDQLRQIRDRARLAKSEEPANAG